MFCGGWEETVGWVEVQAARRVRGGGGLQPTSVAVWGKIEPAQEWWVNTTTTPNHNGWGGAACVQHARATSDPSAHT